MPLRRRQGLRTAALAALAALCGLAAPAAQAQSGGVGFRVDGAPGSQMSEGYMQFPIAASGSANGYFFATNTGDRTANITLFAADGLTGTTSGVVYGDIAEPTRRAGSWITPDTGSFTLEPRTERRINFSIRVPAGTAAGDHIGGIVLQQVNPKSTGQVAQIVRNVVPIHVEVPTSSTRSLEIRDAKLNTLPGTKLPAVDVSLRNTGRLMCRPTLAVTLKGPSENNVRVSRQLDALLPTDRITFPLPWPSPLASGSYLVKVSVTGCGTAQSGSFTSTTPGYDPDTGKDNGKNNGKDKPRVETDATPTLPAYTPGTRLTSQPPLGNGDSTNDSGSTDDGDDDGAGAAPPKDPPPPGVGTIGTGNDLGGASLLDKAKHAALTDGDEIAKRASLLLLLLAAIGFLFFIQEALDRRDPKLALAPVHRDPELSFDSDPLATRQVEPSPSGVAEAT